MHSILAARTDFSIGESILSPEKVVEQAVALGAKVAAITDTMSVTGMIDFTTRAKKAGIQPIIGVRLRLVDEAAWRAEKGDKKNKMGKPHYFATAYALSEAGVAAIFRLLSLANSTDRFYHVSRLEFADLYAELDKLSEHDVALTTGDVRGIITHPQVDAIADEILSRGIKLYAALVPINTPYFGRINQIAIDLVDRKDAIRPLAVRPAYYEEGSADEAEIMAAIAANNLLTDGWHKSTHNRDFHLLSASAFQEQVKVAATHLGARAGRKVGAYFMEGLRNTDELAKLCKFEWAKQPVSLPKMAPDEFAEVVRQCKVGWAERFNQSVFGHKPSQQELLEVYKPRLAYELSILKKLEFSGYFLLVEDVVQYAKSNGILVGPGRGSVGGSLVAYLMGITDCDPLRFGLLFERFINPDRIDLPDVDLDFMSERRHEVVDYLVKKYGEARVAGVSNYGRLAAASSIRDVGRVAGLAEREYRCSKFVPKLHGAHVPLADCAAQVPDIQEFSEKHEALWGVMLRLENTMRSYGQHAAGIVVGGCDLVERGVIERRKGEVGVVCWDKRIVEDTGLVKMDILGLNTLDLIKLTLDYIRERHKEQVNLMRIPLDDDEVLASFAKGLTTGVFQFESTGMRRLLKELGADGTITFDDITAATALYRPGPIESGMMDSYFLRKQGNETIEYDHPLMEEVLKDTYGVMVYQEQVMKVARVVAGYSGPDADKLRKIMGKKLPEEMKKERQKFVDGAVATIGAEPDWAAALFDKIEGFAGYGFNKSHSVEYTLISYQSMWLKTKYPVEFFAAALSLQDEAKLPGIIRDAQRYGIDVSMPDINISTGRFEIATDVRLVIPFQRIKGVAATTTNAIIAARAAGPFKDKADFLERVEKRKCNIKHQDLLDRVGAFSRIEPGQLPATDPSRIRDQLELLPGLITQTVPVNREMHTDKVTRTFINDITEKYRAEHGPTGSSDGMPVKPFFGRDARFMIITDCPTFGEEAEQKMSVGKQVAAVIDALSVHDLSRSDVYWTGLIKRPKADKQVSSEEINLYREYLDQEIETLQPPVIVLLGAQTVRHFLPDFKGKASDEAGKIVYSAAHDANLVIGFNPGEIYFAPEKQTLLEDVFHSVMDLLP